MRHIPIRLGPLALLLTVITICLSVLAVLSLSNSAADKRLSERYAEAVRTRYQLEKEGQEYLQGMKEDAPQGEEEITKTFEREGYTLTINLVPVNGQYEVSRWQIQKEWQEDTTIGNLWQGN